MGENYEQPQNYDSQTGNKEPQQITREEAQRRNLNQELRRDLSWRLGSVE